MNGSLTIQKNPALPPQQDYTALRKSGIELIQQLGSALWTDYNIHDPGITLLELLCYATTDLGYRQGFSIEDLLAPKTGKLNTDEQAFYTARNILSINPLTPNDNRKLLIDLNGVRNAWHLCSNCGCGLTLYANCKKSTLQYLTTEHPVKLRGFNDALIELEIDPVAGDLNSGKIFSVLGFLNGTKLTAAAIECRMPPWSEARNSISNLPAFVDPQSKITPAGVKVTRLAGQPNQPADIAPTELYKALRNPLYANFAVACTDKTNTAFVLELKNVPFKVWYRSVDDRKALTVEMLRKHLELAVPSGTAARYQLQLRKAAEAMAEAETALHAHRNLAEDFCNIVPVPVCDVALCADIEMEPTADIEAVLGRAYYLIDQYFSPSVPFHSLQELLNRGVPVEEIFNGPALQNGFLLNSELERSVLKTELHTSDVINILMDIEGIKTVKNITLARYSKAGQLVESQPWTLKVPDGHQPRLYVHASKVLVYKNNLPFLPDNTELNDSLQRLKSQYTAGRFAEGEKDLPVPRGKYVHEDNTWPLQNMLPDTYGTGPNGLPEAAGNERKARAKQLKAYLLVLEHLLQAYLMQLKHFRDLLSTNPAMAQTWFAQLYTEKDLPGVEELYRSGFSEPDLTVLLESRPEFIQRRNRFLDHLLARFAEDFSGYALQMYLQYGSEQKAGEALIADKIRYLQKFPEISALRARAINYRDAAAVCTPSNEAGLQKRIRLLLGLNGLEGFVAYDTAWSAADKWSGAWRLTTNKGETLLSGLPNKSLESETALRTMLVQEAQQACLALNTNSQLKTAPAGNKVKVQLLDSSDTVLATSATNFDDVLVAQALIDAIGAFVSKVKLSQKIHVVEHLLLRPRTSGDPLLSICIPGDCTLCGEEDPYSFRITIVLNGEQLLGLANQGIQFRDFAEQAIRKEVPAHLGVKICWVSEDVLAKFEMLWCAYLAELAKQPTDAAKIKSKLATLLALFANLKSVYPPATLHDCDDGDDENRIFLNKTVI